MHLLFPSVYSPAMVLLSILILSVDFAVSLRLRKVSLPYDCSSADYGCISPVTIPIPDNMASGSLSMSADDNGMPQVESSPGDLLDSDLGDTAGPTKDPAERFTIAPIVITTPLPPTSLEICQLEKCVPNPPSNI